MDPARPRSIRGRKLDTIIGEQLEPALAMRPDLVTVYAGANDILHPRSTSTASASGTPRPSRG